ncbi:MAG: hypothetical protein E7E98_08235 [Cutibacterium avidum]|nr:hypothetical protein [Cutibacterium avidum]
MMSRTATTIHSGGGGTHSTSTRSTAGLLALLMGSAALVGTGAINLHQAPEAHAAATIPTVDCSTDKSFINTGWNGSKVLGDNTDDDNWEVSYNTDPTKGYGWPNGTGSTIALPPSNATWHPAKVGKMLSSPYKNANWISAQFTPIDEGYTNNQAEPGSLCTTGFQVSKIVKGTDAHGNASPGTKLTYDIAVTNTGKTDYTADDPASFTDDLSKVLDDATYNKDVSNGATVDGNKLSWKGALAQGETKVITYSVTVNKPEKGNYSADNTVTPGKGGSCATGKVCATSNPIHAYTVRKSSDKKTVKAGDVINTTLRQLMLDAVITAYPDLPCLKHD